VYKTYSYIFGVNLEEVGKPLKEYNSLGEFFARSLTSGVRVWKQGDFGSPVDGTVYYYGPVSDNSIEQIKGIKYTLSSFLGEDSPLVEAAKHKQLYHISLYLAPGDYHGIHSPTDWVITKRRHIPGRLLPVAPIVVNNVSGIFAANERVVLEGTWEHGLFSLTPVGASNVGSIKVPFDPELITNAREAKKEAFYDRDFGPKGMEMTMGKELAVFHMGSTVVLVFECPANYSFQFNVRAGQKVELGQPIGKLVKTGQAG